MSFEQELLLWYHNNGRDLPWRQTHDAYVIWLSEIILQQTRVEQGTPYFHRFVDAFPSVADFAAASEDEILRLWQGLGYYSRARNMHKAAKMVMTDFEGVFPTHYKELLTLPGVGEYTAAAISSFSSNEKRAVLDGNVFRVLSRYYGIDIPINSSEGKKVFAQLSQELISDQFPGTYNHAIMDFGAIQCKPKAPNCHDCIFSQECVALAKDIVAELPVKLKAKQSRNRYFHYFIVESEKGYLMSKRGEKDVWANLYEFPLIETADSMSLEELLMTEEFKQYFDGATVELIVSQSKHVLSHQNIYASFYRLSGLNFKEEKKEGWSYCLSENLDKLAKHKLIFSFINQFIKR